MFCRTGSSTIVFDGGRVLLIKRGKDPYKGHWSLPGGAQEIGETICECAARELREETGLTAKSLQFLTTRDRITRDVGGNITHHYVLSTFLVNEFTGTALAGDDAVEIGWFMIDELQKLQTTPETPSFVAEMLSVSSET